MQEVWKDIPNFEGIYQASTLGRIRTKNGKTTHSIRHGIRTWQSRILKPKACKDFSEIGYRVTLWKDKKPYDFLVARLVCATFKENLLDTKMTVNHIDGNRLNNNIENLEWLSRGDNIRHAFSNGLYTTQHAITLECDGSIMYFRSKSQASRFLRRCSGYVSDCLAKGKPITDDLGNVYTVAKK